MTNSKTEQSAYDFKQGFYNLAERPVFDNNSFDKIMETCTAIANIRPNHKGYVLVGVADSLATAARITEIFKVQPISYSGFHVTGIEHEAIFAKKKLEDFFQQITKNIQNSGVSEPLKSYLSTHLKCVRYYDKSLFVFEIMGQSQPSLYDGKFFERQGPQNIEIPPENLKSLFSRFT